MRYYACFDGYGHLMGVVSQPELAERYRDDPEEFLRRNQPPGAIGAAGRPAGHVAVLNFSNNEELQEFLDSLGDEIEGFYGCRSESRPYNF